MPSQTRRFARAMNNTTGLGPVNPKPVKVILSLLPCLFFLYVNGVMLFALLKKPFLQESPRYILFGHLLISDSLQLVLSILLYIFAVTLMRMISYACAIFTLLAVICLKLSPINLAVMSLERYVAIRFPLRHAQIVTTRRAGKAIAVMWTVASFDSFVQIFLFIGSDKQRFNVLRYCDKTIIKSQTLYMIFMILHFVTVGVIILYTYVAIMISVKSASDSQGDPSKAHRTVLLHMLQLGLCIISNCFQFFNSMSDPGQNRTMAIHVQYTLFLGLIILPKCLSPLIYGLRDHTFRGIFFYYFTFGLRRNKLTSQT